MKTHLFIRASLVTALAFQLLSAEAALYFWDNGAGAGDVNWGTTTNWDPDGVPGPADLAVANNAALPAVSISTDQSADSFRLSNGGAASQSGGTFTITNGVGPDNGLWVGEFGPAQSSYTLSAGTLQINDGTDGFQIGRGGSNSGVFTMTGGTVNKPAGDTVVGLDGTALWDQSGGTFNGAGVQVGWFQSPTATVNLSGAAVWNTGLVLLSDGSAGFPAAIRSDLNVSGPSVNFTSQGLVVRSKGNVNFDGSGGGISPLALSNGQLLLDNASLGIVNLPTGLSEVPLITGIGSYTGNAAFVNAPQGTVFGDYTIDYRSDSVVLTAVPEPLSMTVALAAVAGGIMWRRRRVAANRMDV
ncbi:MAG: hypothetical protein RLZZ440_425 [Planctomycetota bacterium]